MTSYIIDTSVVIQHLIAEAFTSNVATLFDLMDDEQVFLYAKS